MFALQNIFTLDYANKRIKRVIGRRKYFYIYKLVKYI